MSAKKLFFTCLLVMLFSSGCEENYDTPYNNCVAVCDQDKSQCDEQNFQMYGRTMKGCMDYSPGTPRATCEKDTTESWDQARTDCKNTEKSCIDRCAKTHSSSGARPIGPENECPRRMELGPLGQCMAKFKPGDGPKDVDPTDRCEKGTVLGPDDACIPVINIAYAVRGKASEWFVVCPPGSRPGPVDGCVLDYSEGKPLEDMEIRKCQPGTAPAPDDGGCVPIFQLMGNGNLYGLSIVLQLKREGKLETTNWTETERLLKSVGVFKTADLMASLEITAQNLGLMMPDPR